MNRTAHLEGPFALFVCFFWAFFCKVHSESQEAYNNSKQLASTTNVMCKWSHTGWIESSSQTENGTFWERSLTWNSTKRLWKQEGESASIRKTWCPPAARGGSSRTVLQRDEMLTSQKWISGGKNHKHYETLWGAETKTMPIKTAVYNESTSSSPES